MHDPSSLHEMNSVFHFGLLCINFVHIVVVVVVVVVIMYIASCPVTSRIGLHLSSNAKDTG